MIVSNQPQTRPPPPEGRANSGASNKIRHPIAESLAKVLEDVDRNRLKPMYVHFEGNRRDIARETIRKAGFAPCERLGDAVRAAAAVSREI